MVLRTPDCGIGREEMTISSKDAEIDSTDLDLDKEQELGGRGGEGWSWLSAVEFAAVVSSSKLWTELWTDSALSSIPKDGATFRLSSYSYSPASKYLGLDAFVVIVVVLFTCRVPMAKVGFRGDW